MILYWPAPSVTTDRDLLDQDVARRFDLHAGQHGARRVLDDADDGALRVRGRRKKCQSRPAAANTHTCDSSTHPAPPESWSISDANE